MSCRDEAVPASGDGSAAAQAGAQPPAAEPALAERQPSAAMDAGGGVDEAELGVTQLMEGAGRDSNALAQLEASLRPIERYAVRVVEEVSHNALHAVCLFARWGSDLCHPCLATTSLPSPIQACPVRENCVLQ